MSQAVVPGSISAVAATSAISIAEAFLGADIIAIVDVSGSMREHDSRGGRSRYAVAVEELRRLQERNVGKVAVVAFNGAVEFCPAGIPPEPMGGTDLAGALRFVKVADGCVRFVVISDGQPDDEQEALAVAKDFASRIDAIFVGDEADSRASAFLRKLAAAHGGKSATAARAQELAATIETLALKAG
jgi:Mg-chelatase subunit ChlD